MEMTAKNSRRQQFEPVFRGKKKKYYESLVDLRDQLVDQIQAISASSLNSSKQAGEELADIGSDNFIREMGLSLMTEEGRKIQDIQDAIEKLKDGSYGVCEECNTKIKDARLEAIPYARLCIDCKSKLEKKGSLA